MDERVKALWTDALESGEFTQTKGVLRDDTGHCCLGVLCELYKRETGDNRWAYQINTDFAEANYPQKTGIMAFDLATGVLPYIVKDWARLEAADPCVTAGPNDHTRALSGLNDDGTTFAQLSSIIKEQL